MSYEFIYYADENLPDGLSDDSVTVPEYSRAAPEKIHQISLFEPFFLKPSSVVEDTKTGRVGIDTNDKYCDLKQDKFSEEYMGVMHIELLNDTKDETEVKGTIVDLRYRKKPYKRDLGFCALPGDEEASENISYDEANGTQEAVALIIFDELTQELHLRVKSQHRESVIPYAISLMQFVDQVRQERDHEVICNVESTTTEQSTDSKIDDTSNAPTHSSKDVNE